LQGQDLIFIRLLFVHERPADGRDDLPCLDGACDDHENPKKMFGEDRQRPLRAGRKESVIMRVDAHLEQPGDKQKTHAEPCDGLESFLHGFDQCEMIHRLEGFFRGGEEQYRNGNNTTDPRDGGEQMQPECERQRPGGRIGHHGVGVSDGGTEVSVAGGAGCVSVGVTIALPSVVGVNKSAGSGVAVAG